MLLVLYIDSAYVILAQASHTPSAIALVVFRTVSLTVLLIVSCCGNFLVSFTLYRFVNLIEVQ